MSGPLTLGKYDVTLECPECGDPAIVTVELLTVRHSATDTSGTLRLKVKAHSTPHRCDSPRFPEV